MPHQHTLRAEGARLVRYGLVGVANTLVCGLCIWLLRQGLGAPLVVATVVGYGVAFLFSFWANFYFTFRAQGRVAGRFAGFAMVAGAAFLVALAVQSGLVAAGLAETVAVATGMVVYTLAGYTLNRLWVFGSHRT